MCIAHSKTIFSGYLVLLDTFKGKQQFRIITVPMEGAVVNINTWDTV